MAFFGPGFTLNTKPKWRQSWWWRERLPGIIAMSVVVLLAVGAGVVGWMAVGDDTGSGPVPEQTATPNRTAPPTNPNRSQEDPPERPKAMSEPSQEGIEATVRYSFDAANYAQRTGDVEPMKRVYALEYCAVCAGFANGIKKLTAGGRYLDGASYTVGSATDITLRANSEGEPRGTVEVQIKRDSGRQLEADGGFVKDIPADPAGSYELSLSFDNGAWRIYGT